MPRLSEFKEKRKEILKLQNIPRELLPLYQEPLLDKDQEQHLFRQFNYYKYKAKKLARILRQKEAITEKQYKRMKEQVERIEEYLKHSNIAKHQLVNSNTRLAAQLLKKQHAYCSNDDLLSDAYTNIVKAVDCFDWTRGFKFSTYATWVLRNNFNRDLTGERAYFDRFATGYEDEIYDTRLDNSDEDIRDYEESNELAKKTVTRLLGLLNKKEDKRKRYVIEEWFGLRKKSGGPKRTLKNISADLGITKEGVRQLRERGLEDIRERIRTGNIKI